MVAQAAKNATNEASHERHAEFGGDFGIDVLQPIYEAGVFRNGYSYGDDRGERRVGFRNENITVIEQRACAMPHPGTVGDVIYGAAEKPRASKACGSETMDMYPVNDFLRGESSVGR